MPSLLPVDPIGLREARREAGSAQLGLGLQWCSGRAPRTRTWRGDDGSERSRLEIVADEVGPSLHWATTQITKTAARG